MMALEGQNMVGWDIVAGRLRAIIHFDVSGSWRVAEQMESVAARDIGLVDYEELYAARRMAKLTALGGDSSSDSGEAPAPKKKAKKYLSNLILQI